MALSGDRLFDRLFAKDVTGSYVGLPGDVGFGAQFGDGLNAITAADLQVALRAPWAGAITRIVLDADASCSATVNLLKNGTTIFGGGSTEPTLSSSTEDDKADMTDITTAIAAGDAFVFTLDTVSGSPKRLSCTVFVQRRP